MYKYTPSLPAGETGRNTRQYIKDHHDVFLRVLKPLIPFFVGAALLDVVLNTIFGPETLHIPTDGTEPEPQVSSPVGGIITAYFTAALVISWHRMVIHGPDEFIAMNPLKPQKSEIKFMLVGLAIGVLGVAAWVIITMVAVFIMPALAIVVFLVLIPLFVFLAYRIWFYFPALATNAPISFQEAFRISKGYVWKLIVATWFACWRVSLATMGLSIVMAMIIGGAIIPVFIAFEIRSRIQFGQREPLVSSTCCQCWGGSPCSRT